jgi:hypothetical protein
MEEDNGWEGAEWIDGFKNVDWKSTVIRWEGNLTRREIETYIYGENGREVIMEEEIIMEDEVIIEDDIIMED